MIRNALSALLAAIVLLLAPFASDTALADRRVALVIGNSHYKNPNTALANPQNDAADVAAVLRKLGFEVLQTTDADKHGFDESLQKFARLAPDADAALFYYAGHAMQYEGRNYLMPVDAELLDEVSLAYQMVSFDAVRFAINRAKGAKIVILDACRNNPVADRFVRSAFPTRDFASVRGLARIDKSEGMVVSYATAAGEVAEDGKSRNSPYTTALLRRMNDAGLEIVTMFRRVAQDVTQQTKGRQQPETVFSSGLSDFYLNRLDVERWQKIKDTDDAAVFRDFIATYPSSALAVSAKSRLDMLAAAAQLREQARRDEDARRKAERDKADADKQLAALAAQAAPPPPPGPRPDEIAWEYLKDSHNEAALKRFIAQFPDSARRAAAEQRIASLAADAAAAAAASALPAAPTAAPKIDPREIARSVQAELKRVGCFGGAVDGDFGAATRTALRDFVKYASVKLPDEDLTPDTLKALRGFDKRVCPLQCPPGQRADGNHCVAIVCPAGEVLKDGACHAVPQPPKTAIRHPDERTPKRRDQAPRAAQAAPVAPKAANRNDAGNDAGILACGRYGCQRLPKGCRPSLGTAGGFSDAGPTCN